MARVHALVGVAVCLLAVVIGCKSTEISGLVALDAAATNKTVNGSLDVVALSTKADLEKLKLNVVLEQDPTGNTYYLSTKSQNGNRFRLVLTRVGSGPTEKTNLNLEWIDARDNSFDLHLLGGHHQAEGPVK